METIKKHFSLLLGIGLFTTGLFNFNHSTYSGGYYYDEGYVFHLVAGSILIAIGILKKIANK